jgi:hypothetical protein
MVLPGFMNSRTPAGDSLEGGLGLIGSRRKHS